MRARLWLALLAFLAQAGTPARPEEAATPQVWTLPQLMAGLSAVKTKSARFVEFKYLHMLKRPIRDTGTLFYRAPDHVEKDTLQPTAEHLLLDGDRLTIDHDGKSQTLQLEDYPQIAAFIEGIRATLAGDLSALERVYVVRLEGNVENWQLSLQPRDAKMLEIVKSIRIYGTGSELRHVDTQEGDGDRSEMTITETPS